MRAFDHEIASPTTGSLRNCAARVRAMGTDGRTGSPAALQPRHQYNVCLHLDPHWGLLITETCPRYCLLRIWHLNQTYVPRVADFACCLFIFCGAISQSQLMQAQIVMGLRQPEDKLEVQLRPKGGQMSLVMLAGDLPPRGLQA